MMNGKTITCTSIHSKWVLFPNTNNVILYYFIKYNLQFSFTTYSTHLRIFLLPTQKRTHPHPEKYIPVFY